MSSTLDVSDLLDSLNPDQRAAVCAESRSCLVLAGAGSGKTRVLTHRIAWLCHVNHVARHRVMAVTFTNKAAAEMRQRLGRLMQEDSRAMWLGTFHGLAHRLLRLHWQQADLPQAFNVLDSDDQLRMIKQSMKALRCDEANFPPKQAMWWINSQKDEGRQPEHLQPNGNDFWYDTLRRIYAHYQHSCARAGMVDFAELLLRAHALLREDSALLSHYQSRFQHILVDEFQDTNAIQYAFIRLLAGASAQVFAVGDDDQAIYGWRGAKVEHVQQFLQDFAPVNVIRLEQNYRSTGNILAVANAIIAQNPNRFAKQLWTQAPDGDPVHLYTAYNERDEANFVVERACQWVQEGGALRDCAILYRSNAQSRVFEERLLAEQMPYRVYGGLRFFERSEIKDAMAYLRLLANRRDDAAFERCVTTPARGIGQRTIAVLRQLGQERDCSLWQAALASVGASPPRLAGRARHAVNAFIAFIDALAEQVAAMALADCVDHVVTASGIRAYWQNESKGRFDTQSRRENLDELVSVASYFVPQSLDPVLTDISPMQAFLAHAALESGEHKAPFEEEGIQLMSLHAAKGLEFRMVFVVGLEEGLFPSARALESGGRLEEERRLAYVGTTRAQSHLILSYAKMRRLHGVEHVTRPSRFLSDIPRDLIDDLRLPVTVYPTKDRDALPFALGATVAHSVFGQGVVVHYEGSGAHTHVQVQFDNGVGAKWLVLGQANLKHV